jgi:phage tail sheath protein FI
MAERLHPGVYIEEVPSGVRPIEGISTSTAAFIGKAELGTMNKAALVTSVPEFEAKYGKYLNGFFLSHAVHQFYNNGGKKCYIVRVAGAGAQAAAISIKDRRAAPAKTLTISASSEGDWGNKLDVVIKDGAADPDNEFALQVYRDRSQQNPPLSPLLLENHDNLSMDSEAANFVGKLIVANSKYIAVNIDAVPASAGAGTSQSGKLAVGNGADLLKLLAGPLPDGATATPGANLPAPSAGTLRSGSNPNLNPPADRRQFRINLDGDGEKVVTLPPEAQTGPGIAAAIQAAVRALSATTASNQDAYTNFTSVFDPAGGGSYLLTSGTAKAGSSVAVTSSTATPVSLPAGAYKFVIFVNGDGPHEVTVTIPAGPNADGAAIALAIRDAVRALPAKRSANTAAFSGFTASYDTTSNPGNPSLLLTSGTPGVNSSVRISSSTTPQNVAGTLKLGATNGGKEIIGSSILRPANSANPTEYHLGDAVVSGNVASVVSGSDGATPGPQDFINGLNALDVIRDVNILSIPGIYGKSVVDAGTNYCAQRMDCFFIGDPDPLADTVEEARDFVNGLTVKSSYGAVYYPWLKSIDPTGASPDPIDVPPSGFVAGMYARIDARRGVWKAPAGTEANVGGAVGLSADTTDAQQDFLNPIGVNVIRSFPASGIVIWGARTLATRSDPEYRYVPVRRTAIFLEQSIYGGIQWAVFEPNDEPLWSSLRLNIGAFMMLQFRAGAFQGKTPNDAFFVLCDDKTTTQADIDAGIVNIRVGFAPLKPAEFVVLKLSQKVNQPAT